jgi:hypothetical protein
LWAPRLRILFVLDGRISTTDDSEAFGLGLVLDTLTDDSYAWWVGYEVHVVRRDDGTKRMFPPLDRYPEKLNVQFTDSDFNIDDYDQIWFFGDYPKNETFDPSDERYHPLSDPELKLLAEWMDRGGGVFATGDHYNLGASMCSRIPRVRTMRKWTVAQGVPPQHGNLRNETLQPSSEGWEDLWEGDTLAQPIEPVYRRILGSLLFRPLWPHALLSLPFWGVITKFPDHMHEGQVFDDDAVKLDEPLNIDGYNGVEYPSGLPGPVVTTASAVTSSGSVFPRRPRPHVVAYGYTTHEFRPQVFQRAAFPPNPTASLRSARRIGLVGAYEGDLVGVGRVVVDSTWHHWFSLNLHGFRDSDPAIYQNMQAYYRNVGLWLTTSAQRRSILVAAVWGVVASDPMAFPDSPDPGSWAVGERVMAVLGRTASQPAIADLVKAFFPTVEELLTPDDSLQSAEPSFSALPWDLTLRAIVGGIATALLKPASDYHAAHRDRGRRRLLDPDAIVRHAAEGAQEGHAVLVASLQSASTSANELADRLEADSSSVPPESIPIAVELVQLRVVAEQLQMTGTSDRARGDGDLALTARITAAGTVVANHVLEKIDASALEKRGGFVDLDVVLYEGVVQSGERIVIEVFRGAIAPHDPGVDQVRYREAVDEAPSTWIGGHAPSPAQPWRLWYRVERSKAS